MNSVKRRILIVDDEESLTWSLAKNLQRQYQDHQVYALNSGEEALAILKQLSFDLVITDLQMPDVDGLVILNFVKKKTPDVPVIIMTSLDNSEIRHLEDHHLGIYYFEKPFDMVELKKTINAILIDRYSLLGRRKKTLPINHLIRTKILEKFDGIITVKYRHQTGVLHFQAGELVHVQTEKCEGELALLNVLSWKNVIYDIERNDTAISHAFHYGMNLNIEKVLASG